MKKLSLIALLLAALLCLGACAAKEVETDDEDEKIEEAEKDEAKDEEADADEDDADADVDVDEDNGNENSGEDDVRSYSFVLNPYNSDFNGIGNFTKNSDGTFAIRGSYPVTWTESDFERVNIESGEITYNYVFEYRGSWTDEKNKTICRSDSFYFTIDVEDKDKETVKTLATVIEDERTDALIEAIETGTLIKGEKEFSYIYEFEFARVNGAYKMLVGRDYEVNDPDNLYCTYDYRDGHIATATYYYATGDVHTIHYYANGKVHHIDYFDIEGNKTNTTYPDEN